MTDISGTDMQAIVAALGVLFAVVGVAIFLGVLMATHSKREQERLKALAEQKSGSIQRRRARANRAMRHAAAQRRDRRSQTKGGKRVYEDLTPNAKNTVPKNAVDPLMAASLAAMLTSSSEERYPGNERKPGNTDSKAVDPVRSDVDISVSSSSVSSSSIDSSPSSIGSSSGYGGISDYGSSTSSFDGGGSSF